MTPLAIPVATYRLQLSANFGFAQAAALVPYLQALGVSHLYASPFLKSRPGSTHGYDIVDHNQLDPELGGERGFAELSAALAKAGMGLILDFVPNHMGIGHSDNAWWLDVLEFGPASPYAASFDIDWDLLPFRRHAGVLLPILGEPYGSALAKGQIALKYDAAAGSFSAWYFDHRLPIRPDRYRDIVTTAVRAVGAENTGAGRALLAAVRGRAPSRFEAAAFKTALAAVEGGSAIIEAGLKAYRPVPGDPRSVAPLHRLLERQHYRLAHWQVATSAINYRRFFDINDLAGIRVEHARTFREVHRLVFRLVGAGQLHGIRLDHIDGLYDPLLYCRQLQRGLRTARNGSGDVYTVVEKILAEGETLPPFASVAGTTGYDALNDIMRVLLDPRGLTRLDETLNVATGDDTPFVTIVEACKRLVITSVLASEFRVLVQLLARIAAGHWSSRDFTVERLQAALTSYVIEFPIYRTYITGRSVSPQDRATIAKTIEAAQARWTGSDAGIFSFLQDVMTLDIVRQERSGYSRDRVRRFTMKLQQFTGPVMAKALEDTAFYRYHRLLALNEVGGEPTAEALSVSAFHSRMRERARRHPHAMTATATHDTKRGEDARMRILALSDLADEWSRAVENWMDINAAHAGGGGPPIPSRAHQYMIYQALIGAWPMAGEGQAFAVRMVAYAVKAAREGKAGTSWAEPNADYEAALTAFVGNILNPALNGEFIRSFSEFALRAALLGALNSLSQLTLKLTLPGVPDIYQGSELWDLSLVDPDNRRPVDFAAREHLLSSALATRWQTFCAEWPDGRIKAALLHRLLALRQHRADAFREGQYFGLTVTGRDADKIVAFGRSYRGRSIAVAVGRHFHEVSRGGREWPRFDRWSATIELPGRGAFADGLDSGRTVLRHGRVDVAELFGPLPVAVLLSD